MAISTILRTTVGWWGEGSGEKKNQNYADVIYGCPLWHLVELSCCLTEMVAIK
jgi:hypothetical protein